MQHKYSDIRWKWLEEKGIDVLSDPYQYSYIQSLWSPVDVVQAVFCEAKAGTGKTTLAVLAGAYEVELGTYEKLIYLRNAIPVRDMGFLPGGVKDKEAPYMAPLVNTLDIIQPGTFDKWARAGDKRGPKIEATTSAFTRGLTWKRSFIIIDEAQNFDLEELQTVYTRCSDDCKVVTLGSLRQNDNRKIKLYAGFTPFELYMRHFAGTRTSFHKLETNYRGWFSNHADDIQSTIQKLREAM
jgi:PhoH-like ATPase